MYWFRGEAPETSNQARIIIDHMKKWISFGIGLIVSAGIFVWLIGSDFTVITNELKSGSYIYLLPGAAFFIAGIWTRAVRWKVLLDDQIDLTHSFHIINIGYFASGILPLRLGDVARAWLTTRLDEPIAGFTSLSTIVVERLLDLLAVLAMLGLSLVLLDVPTEVSSAGAVLGIAALAGGIVLAVFASKPKWAHRLLAIVEKLLPFLERFGLRSLLDNFLEGIKPMGRPRIAARALIWTGISWLLSIGAGYIYLFTIFDNPTLSATLAYIVLGSFSVALPAVPGNLGPFEGAVVGGLWIGGLVASASAPQNAPAVAFAAVLHAATLAIYITLGLIGLYYEQASLSQITQGSQELSKRQDKQAEQHPVSMESSSKQSLSDIAHERVS